MPNNTDLTLQEKKILRKSFLLSLQSKAGGTQMIMSGNAMAWALRPLLDVIYKEDKKGKSEVMSRHCSEYLNTNSAFFGLLLGIVMALEKQKKEKGNVPDSVISSIKASLMGPTAGIGDALFFNCIRVIVAGICIGIGTTGNVAAPFIFLLVYCGLEWTTKYFLLYSGYKSGTQIIDLAFNKGIIPLITDAASSLGAIMVGCMIAVNVKVSLALKPVVNGAEVDVQGVLDGILPGLLSVLLWWFVFRKLQKGWSPIKLILTIMIACVVLAFFGIIGTGGGGW